MQRRTLVAAVAILPTFTKTSLSEVANQPLLQALKPSGWHRCKYFAVPNTGEIGYLIGSQYGNAEAI
jgi:hypothetical protein